MFDRHENGVYLISRNQVDKFCTLLNCNLQNGVTNGARCSRWDVIDNVSEELVDRVDVIESDCW